MNPFVCEILLPVLDDFSLTADLRELLWQASARQMHSKRD